MKYSQTLTYDEYESSNNIIASPKELKVFVAISILITLRSYTHLSTSQ